MSGKIVVPEKIITTMGTSGQEYGLEKQEILSTRNQNSPKIHLLQVENRELMLLGLLSSFRFYHFVDPRTTGGKFCSQHEVGAGLNARHNCARCFARPFRAEKFKFFK